MEKPEKFINLYKLILAMRPSPDLNIEKVLEEFKKAKK